MKEIDASFFARDTLEVARDLLGKIVSVSRCSGRIIEVEAYKDDEASHAFSRTPRSEIMYSTCGHVYVYFIYGMYCCLNFTTEDGLPGAVLIRGLTPITGVSLMRKRRGASEISDLCSGPGKLCIALGVDLTVNSSVVGSKVKVFDDGFVPSSIVSSSRIGISKAKELKWRFVGK